jgi:hypothetical protein
VGRGQLVEAVRHVAAAGTAIDPTVVGSLVASPGVHRRVQAVLSCLNLVSPPR